MIGGCSIVRRVEAKDSKRTGPPLPFTSSLPSSVAAVGKVSRCGVSRELKLGSVSPHRVQSGETHKFAAHEGPAEACQRRSRFIASRTVTAVGVTCPNCPVAFWTGRQGPIVVLGAIAAHGWRGFGLIRRRKARCSLTAARRRSTGGQRDSVPHHPRADQHRGACTAPGCARANRAGGAGIRRARDPRVANTGRFAGGRG